MIPLVVGAIFLGRKATIVFFSAASRSAGFTEFARATGLYRDWLMTGWVYLGIVGVDADDVDLAAGRTGARSAGTACSWRCPCTSSRGVLLMPILRDQTQGPAAAHRAGHRRVHLHRLDVRASRVPRERPQRLRVYPAFSSSPCR